MFWFYFIGIVVLLIGFDWLTYKLFPGNKDHLVYRKDAFSIYANRHHFSFHLVEDYDEGQHMQLNMSTLWHSFYIPLPWMDVKYDNNWNAHEYGFYLYNPEPNKMFTEVWVGWGKWHKMISMPWSWEHYRTTYEGRNGNKYTEIGWLDRKYRKIARDRYNSSPIPTREHYELFGTKSSFNWEAPYVYTLKSGETQRTMALYHVEEREWRWKCLQWCPWIHMTVRYLEIELMDEIGERAGSWKGGTCASSRQMLPGESPHVAYERIMKETKHE